jgi:hypothetical protein
MVAFGENGELDRASVFKFDTEANTWSTLAPMPYPCSWHSVSVLNGLVYIIVAGNDYRQILRFDPATGAWSTLARSLSQIDGGASFVGGGHLYAMGGPSGSVERYEVASNTWRAVADMLQQRRNFGAVTIDSMGPAEEQDLFDSLIVNASC